MSVVGGFPLSFTCNDYSELGLEIRPNKASLFLSLFILLVPCVIILTFLLTLSICWSDFTENLDKAGVTFWDTFGIVSRPT